MEVEKRSVAWAVLANLLLVGTAVTATTFARGAPDQFYRLVQEDGVLEWCTFWAFFLGAGVGFAHAFRERTRWPWCISGLALFCLLIAMEEISWGQRLFAYRPPTYFLEHNFQQELNLHNVVSTASRKLALTTIIAGYGIVLPLLLWIPTLRALASRAGLVTAPLALLPSFVTTLVLYLWYPVRFTGEVVELLLGGCLLATLLAVRSRPVLHGSPPRLSPVVPMLATSVVIGLGLASTGLVLPRATPELIEQTRSELQSLDLDLREIAGRRERSFVTKCGTHKRLYSFVRKYDVDALHRLQFGSLAGPGVEPERIEYFLDPWNSPYWVRDKCSKDRSRRTVFVYSFGPNRRRDSSHWEIAGDDLGTHIPAVPNAHE